MSFISKTITNLFNGVSQQPSGIRLDSQMEIQENSVSSLTEGLKKRPPSVHLAQLSSGTLGNSYHHLINRDPANQFIVQIVNGDLKVFDVLGNSKTVLFPDGKAYLTSTTPEDDFTCLTIADYTFVVNKKTIVVGITSAGVPTYDSLVYVKAGNYSTDYQVKINGARVAEKYTSATDVNDIGTAQIAEFLRKCMKTGISGAYYQDTDDDPTTPPVLINGTVASAVITNGGSGYTGSILVTFTGGGGSGATGSVGFSGGVLINPIVITNPGSGYASKPTPVFTDSLSTGAGAVGVSTLASTAATLDATWAVTRAASTLWLQHLNGVDYTLSTQDSGYNGANALNLIKGSIQSFSSLPTTAPKDFLCQVRAGSGDYGDYYVKFVPLSAADTFGQGTWIESQFGALSLDATTMPWTLISNGNGTFTFKKGAWTGSVAGGTMPSFVGRAINDVVFYKNRLGILAGENCILSEAGKFFNYFRTTARTLLDTDPIDVASSSNVVSTLRHGIPFNDQLLLFSDNVQFSLSGGDLLTPKTVSIVQTTAFETDLGCKPVALGKNSYYAFSRGSFSGVKEYYVNRLTTNYDANDITANIQQYIPGAVKRFSKSGTEDILIALASGDRSKLYVHKFFWNNDEKLQAGWSVFSWSDTVTVLFAEFINSILYVVIQRSTGVFLEKLNMASGITDSSFVGPLGQTLYYNTLVDRKAYPLSRVYSSLLGRTTVTFPYTITGNPMVILYGSTGDPGALLPIISQTATSVTVPGDVTANLVILGQSYKQRVRLSEPVVKQQNGQGQPVAGFERCQIKSVAIHSQNTGYFQLEVTPINRTTTIKKYGGKLHAYGSTLGVPNVASDSTLRSPVLSKSNQVTVDLVNESHMPSAFIGIEWVLQIIYKNKKV